MKATTLSGEAIDTINTALICAKNQITSDIEKIDKNAPDLLQKVKSLTRTQLKVERAIQEMEALYK